MPKQDLTIKETSKRNTVINLIGGETVIYQSNRVTNSTFDSEHPLYLYTMRIFISIMYNLQVHIKEQMSGARNATLFDDLDTQNIEIKLAFKQLAPFQKYKEVVMATEQLRQIPMRIQNSKTKENYDTIKGIISHYQIPKTLAGTSKYFYIYIDKDVAEKLILVDKNQMGTPINYTKYLYEVAMSTNSPYTTLLYILISAWKTKGSLFIELDRLKYNLGIKPHQYKNYSNFKTSILDKAQRELQFKADIWFDSTAPDFEIRKGRKVVGINFKLVTKELINEAAAKKQMLLDNVLHMFKTHFGFKEKDIAQFMSIVSSTQRPFEMIHEKCVFLMGYCKDSDIKVPINYILTSLHKEFADT